MLTSLPARQWTLETAAHLLNRAGFGGTPDEIEATRRAGLDTAVEKLLHPPDEPAEENPEAHSWTKPENLRAHMQENRRLKSSPQGRAKLKEARMERRDEMVDLRYWWLGRMRTTTGPLLEKMTLFWHGHFATSAQKVRSPYAMWRQNETFRRNALGNFRTLLKEISRDPAMMLYLDLAKSRKEQPNENWAREVMELFTLGIGNYTEQDIRESARAFTGYRVNLANQQFRYVRFQHDKAGKTFMGRSGDLSGDDILDIIVERPACPEWIGRKLWRFFVEDEPPPEMTRAMADSLRQHNFELRPVLRELFSAAAFYSPRVIRSQIKSPVQFLVQSCKLLETDLPSQEIASVALRQLGQLPFAPPNVKGWDGGKSWISTSTLLFRYNFANYLLSGTGTDNRANLPRDIQRNPLGLGGIIPAELRDKPEELISNLAQRLLQVPFEEKQTETFLAYLKTRAPDRGDETMRRLLHLMMSTPQYQLT